MRRQEELDSTLKRIASQNRPNRPQVTVNPQFKARIGAMLKQAEAEGRELRLSDITDPELQRWAAGKLALQRKPKSKIPGRRR